MPDNEARRLAALRRYSILDTDSERPFDRITQLVASVLDVPIALISLVDVDRQWFKACIGLAESRGDALAMLAVADQALYRAKHEGRNRFVRAHSAPIHERALRFSPRHHSRRALDAHRAIAGLGAIR